MIARSVRPYVAGVFLIFVFLCTVRIFRPDGEISLQEPMRDDYSHNPESVPKLGDHNHAPFQQSEHKAKASSVIPVASVKSSIEPSVKSSLSVQASSTPVETPTETKSAAPEETKKEESDDSKKEKTEEEKQKEKEKECPSTKAWNSHALSAVNTTFHVPKDIVYNPAGPAPSQVVILTASDGKGHNGGIEDILGHTAKNRKDYCEYHGYNYHFVNISKFDLEGAHPVWKKLPAIVDAFNTFPEAQWVFFLDLDAIIMSPKQDLNSLVLSQDGMKKSIDFGKAFNGPEWSPLGVRMPTEVDFNDLDLLISQDHNGINAGSFFLRRSKFTQWFLDMWADPFFMQMDWHNQEQEALLHFVRHHRVFREHVGLIKQRVANAYVEGGEAMGWHDGDLVVHFAGCWVGGKCQERWSEYWNKRVVVSK